MAHQPDAFLSYTRIDDEFFGGAITSLRKLLELGVQVVTGQKNFNIFQDIDGIEFGQQWQKRLDQAILGARFLIPIITPLFFQSDACRDELKKFIAHEKQQKRDDLILPVYFVTAPVLERPDLLREDALATSIAKRERYDWRSKTGVPINDPQMRDAVMELARKIASAIARAQVTAKTGAKKRVRSMISVPRYKLANPEFEHAGDSAFEKASNVFRREEPRPAGGEPRKILWVDDNPDNNVFERTALQSYNIKFELAESTNQALAKLKNAKFDAVISDMHRPRDQQAAYTLLDSLRGDADSTPFFIYGSGSDNPRELRLARSKGAQGFTNSPDELISNVLKLLESQPG